MAPTTPGTKVCLTATPNTGWRFSSWTGTPLDSSNCLTLSSSAAVTANFTAVAQIQNSRSFVSTLGNDADICSVTFPCRTLTAALAVTAPGGEIVVVSSGGYGPTAITQPVTISAVGVVASITTTSGDALAINTTGNVTINGLGLHGQGSGHDGVYVQQAGFLRLYNVTAEGFANAGVEFAAAGNLSVYRSRFTDNQYGLAVLNASAEAYVHRTSFDHNSVAGVYTPAGVVTVADSSAHYNGAGFQSSGGTLVIAGAAAVMNQTGLYASAASAVMQFSSCSIAQNSLYAYSAAASATVSGTSPGTNVATGSANGSLSTATVLQ